MIAYGLLYLVHEYTYLKPCVHEPLVIGILNLTDKTHFSLLSLFSDVFQVTIMLQWQIPVNLTANQITWSFKATFRYHNKLQFVGWSLAKSLFVSQTTKNLPWLVGILSCSWHQIPRWHPKHLCSWDSICCRTGTSRKHFLSICSWNLLHGVPGLGISQHQVGI